MKVAIVILNWNGKHFLEKFLPGIIKYSEKDAEIIVADNGSDDNSLEFLRSEYPSLKLLELKKNLGYAGGYNAAIERVDAEYFILLNSDVEVTENWINPIIRFMEKDENIAACQPKLLSLAEPGKFEYAGAAGGFIDMLGFPFCRGRIFQTTEHDQGQYDGNAEVFWVTGACMFVRSAAFRKVQGFDQDFFAHMEEIDLCWRLKNEGYQIMYCSASTVYHLGGGTLHKSNPRKTYFNFRNNLMMLFKNSKRPSIFFILIAKLMLDGIAGIKFLITDSFLDTWAVVRAHLYFYFHLPRLIKKRARQMNKPVNKVSGIYPGLIVFDYFIRKTDKFTSLKWKE